MMIDKNYIGNKETFSEEACVELVMAVQDENIQFKQCLDKVQNKISGDIAELIFVSEDPFTRIKSLQKTLNNLSNVCEQDRFFKG